MRKIGFTQALTEMPNPKVPRLEMSGNHEVFIEGCKSLVSYAEEEIRLDLGIIQATICGANLTLHRMNLEECSITGQIAGIGYS